ncbi:DUF2586 domain-containing protein [Serratia marcescens]|uniref:DUF2586 domain-containing protein n=1 Tax=Serratia TaxID=613 RepID=UPI000F7E98D0|nr:DUF2586 domain-containing protein [Serratia marcescens]EHT9933500.1 DUF2586 domain-containing protein [Serratia marcescens]EIJ6673426.1 DUF2586 domain-containing protein [Serratia marcescens]RTF37331.1 DUF2586 domain-containing protein [Serratia marcescens]HEI8721970.1 DUF2586 domain-containing protein [Serratia marcescens]
MSWPTIQVNQVNRHQGETKEIERVLLFVGAGKTNIGKTLPVNTQTDLDVLLGVGDSVLKSNLQAAKLNAGQNWFAYVHVLAEADAAKNWPAAVLAAQRVASVEGIVNLVPATLDVVKQAQSLRAEIIAKFGRWQWFILSVESLQKGEGWAEYVGRINDLQKGVAEPAIQLVPRLWGNEPGVLAGRLCNRAVTIADSPARVATGALVEMGSTSTPVDGSGEVLELATLQALEANRFSVPMWYPDYDGLYWSDGRTLDVEGGDFQAIESLRVVDKAARRVRLLAIPKIADRSLNSTPTSIAAHQQYFAKTLREMARSTQINGVTFPGEVKAPLEGDVQITWRTSTKVEIYLVIRTYECPKGITVSLMLDNSLEGAA